LIAARAGAMCPQSFTPVSLMKLFETYTQRSLTFRNRIVVSPMCQYSVTDGVPGHWHMVHLGSRAVGGAGAVIAEATAISPEGRISAHDTGIWNDAQVQAWQPITAFIAEEGAIPGVQLAHAGRKASVQRPWEGGGSLSAAQGAWQTVAPSAVPFDADWHVPHALDAQGLRKVVDDFRAAAVRAKAAGFKLIEIHGAHGYLLHQFMSPLSNHRSDEYGGSFENRTRLVREVIAAVREVWPAEWPLWLRVSATDWAEGGWNIDESVRLAGELQALGVDLVDVSSGGLVPHVKIPVAPGYQVPFAARIRQETGMPTGAVGLITEPAQAEGIIAGGAADLVLIARASLRDPYFPRRAAQELGATIAPPVQYLRAW
jgi:2,4-dienoyl-CoA reductase-like NADH-dependent reductase (Old Yellow Enzyme family)